MSFLRRVGSNVVVMAATMMVFSATAGAVTLGSTSGTPQGTCTGTSQQEVQVGAAASSYTVPAGGGLITSWSFNTVGSTPGDGIVLVVVAPAVSGYTVVATDSETIPASPPAIQTYNLATPITVQAGDLIGIASNSNCVLQDSTVTLSDTVEILTGSLTVGGLLTPSGLSVYGYLVNVSANLVQTVDASITQSAVGSSTTTGGTDAFLLSINGSPTGVAPVTVTDAVPTGLKIDSVVASSGTCATTGQIISCTGVSTSATIAVIVTPTQAGQFTNNASVSVASVVTDPNSANNSSSATVTVTTPASTTGTTGTTGPVNSASQVTPAVATIRWSSLTRLPLTEARDVIRDLGLKIGTITHKHSKSIHKGDVISTSALVGQDVPVGTTITIVASSGKPKPKRG